MKTSNGHGEVNVAFDNTEEDLVSWQLFQFHPKSKNFNRKTRNVNNPKKSKNQTNNFVPDAANSIR